jgi:hypothetical protein
MRSSVIDTRRATEAEVGYKRYEAPSAVHRPPTRRPAIASKIRKQQGLIFAPVEGWLSLVLLAIAVYTVVLAIVDARWVDHSEVLLWCPIVGLLAGLVVAKLPRMPQAILHLGACLLGHWFSVWLTAVVAYHVSWLFLLSSIKVVIFGGVPPTAVPNTDVIFFFYLAFLCFFLSYFGCWLIYRAHLPWLVALVYCSIMLVNLNSYTHQDLSYLLIVLLGALMLLIARVQLAAQVTQWMHDGLYTNATWMRNLSVRCMQIASVLMVITLLITWLSPVRGQLPSSKALWDSLNNAWSNITNGHVSLQNPSSLLQPYEPPTNFFGDQLTITGSVHLPTGEVIEYTSDSGPHYLEGFTYDQFDGHTWTTLVTDANAQAVAPGSPLKADVPRSDDTEVTTNIAVVQPPESNKHYLFAPAQPIAFDVASQVYSNGTATMWAQQSPLVSGEHYQALSLVPPTDAQTLMTVPLPAADPGLWRTDSNSFMLNIYYRQVPHDLSPNILTLAHQWTQGANDTYSALKMLESHLSDQNTFTYSVENPPIPANTDVVDWLLKTHTGYCTYYASAMVVMARQLGIPARMVNGFSQGHYDAQRRVWVIDGSDAHSWVQAYLPGFGWISFDPTPGFSLTSLQQAHPTPPPSPTVPPQPTKAIPTPQPTKPVIPPQPPQNTSPTNHPLPPTRAKKGAGLLNMNMLVDLSMLVLAISLCFFLVALAIHWWRNLYAQSSPVAGIFWRLCWVAAWVGLSPRTSQTPYEYSYMLSQQFPQRAHTLYRLTDLFVRDRWGIPQPTLPPHEEAFVEQLWANLRGLFFEMIFRKVRK